MGKTWLEIRTRTLGLGFEKTKAYDKNRRSYIDAYNWARTFIASTQGALPDFMTVEKRGRDFPTVTDLRLLAREKGKIYSTLARGGVIDTVTGERISGALVSDNRYLHLPACFEGEAGVCFLALPADIDEETPDDFVCPLPEKWAKIMPYLMASRLYLDDDRGKAGYYWNLFDDMKNRMLALESLPIATVVTEENVWAR